MGRHRSKNFDLPPRMRRRVLKTRVHYYYDHGMVEGKRHWEPLGTDLDAARKRWAEIEAEEPPEGTVSALLAHYRKEALPNLAKRTQGDRKAHIARLDGVFGAMAADELQPHHIARYLRQHAYPVSANREVGTLSAAYSFAVEWGMIHTNPCRQVRRNPESRRDRYITHDEFRTVRKLAPPMIQVAMDLAYATGMRRGDLLALRWDQVDDNEGIRVRQEKTGRKQFIEWTPGLRRVLDRAKALREGETVLCRVDGKPYTSHGFSAMWQRVMVKARKQGVDFTFHDIRAKTGTDAKEAGLDSQNLLGHTTEAQHQTYLRSKAPVRVTPVEVLETGE